MLRSWTICSLILSLVATSFAQSWRTAYENGIRFSRDARWAEAREAYKSATSFRPDDQSGPTSLPGPVTEQRLWRDGAPYSPNFLAAYSAYKQALGTTSSEEQVALWRAAASEFEAILAKKQHSKETYFFLNETYTKLNDPAGRQRMQAAFQSSGGKM